MNENKYEWGRTGRKEWSKWKRKGKLWMKTNEEDKQKDTTDTRKCRNDVMIMEKSRNIRKRDKTMARNKRVGERKCWKRWRETK